MATEPIDPALKTTSTEGEEKVTYTEAQQAHLQTLIDSAVGRSARTLRAELDVERTEKSRLAAELTAAQEAARTAASKTATTPEDQTREIERVKAEHKAALDAANAQLAERSREAAQAKADAQAIRTESAITSSASKVPFIDLGVVLKLTKDQVKYDSESGRFTVLTDAGQPRLNSSFEPMTLDEFYVDYAAKNKFLVRGNVVAGTGSSENRSTLSSNGKYELTELFGPKSSGAKAAQVMKDDPNEYRRLKVLAKSAGLIA
jgi:hypothetical protein